MALCLASSLIALGDFVSYDQLLRYHWWYRYGYMSSTGICFDIGAATRKAILEFENRQRTFCQKNHIPEDKLDPVKYHDLLKTTDWNCGEKDAAGNGSLMRLAPVPLFFHSDPTVAVKLSGMSSDLTHGSQIARDACRYYGALIVAALRGATKDELLSPDFYEKRQKWFGPHPLNQEIMDVARGSYTTKKPDDEKNPIRGKGYVTQSLEAALWAFKNDKDSFQTGVLAAVNLGDDADTTAAIYGQLAGAYYGYRQLPREWVKKLYGRKLITCFSKWIYYRGQNW